MMKPSKRSVKRAISNYGVEAERSFRGTIGANEEQIRAGIHLGKLCGVKISREEMQGIVDAQNERACEGPA